MVYCENCGAELLRGSPVAGKSTPESRTYLFCDEVCRAEWRRGLNVVSLDAYRKATFNGE